MNENGLVLCITLIGDINKPDQCHVVFVRDHGKQDPIWYKFPGGQTEGLSKEYAVRHELADETGLQYDCGSFRHGIIGETVADDGYVVTFYAVVFTNEYAHHNLEAWGDEPELQVIRVPLSQLKEVGAMLLPQHKKWLGQANRAWLGKILQWYNNN